MINEERVTDIIQCKGTVWCINKWQHPYRIQQVVFDGRQKINPHTFVNGWGAENIFETEEEAEEFLKYGDVTRTEKFLYVSWEEFCEGKTFSCADYFKRTSYYVWQERNYIYIKEYWQQNEHIVFKEPLTRENYHKALDLCVKLWKGEE